MDFRDESTFGAQQSGKRGYCTKRGGKTPRHKHEQGPCFRGTKGVKGQSVTKRGMHSRTGGEEEH